MIDQLLIKQADGSYILHVKLTPNAKEEKIDGVFVDENNVQYLKVYTTTIPEDNKANKQLIKILSKNLKVAKSNIVLLKGHKARQKTLQIIK